VEHLTLQTQAKLVDEVVLSDLLHVQNANAKSNDKGLRSSFTFDLN